MSVLSLNDKLANLRKLKAESTELRIQIEQMKQEQEFNTHMNTPIKRLDSYDKHRTRLAADPTQVAEWVQRDFQEFNGEIIEKKLKTERAKVMLNGIMQEADHEYNKAIRVIGIDNLSSTDDARQLVTQNHNNTKRILIRNPEISDTRASTPISSAPSLLDDEDLREIINEFIDWSYSRIIKIVKVYIIRAKLFLFDHPDPDEITELKQRLEGHMHMTRSQWSRLPLKSRIEYLAIQNNKVKLLSGWIMKITPCHLFITHKTIGWGSGMAFRKWKKLNHYFPIFHKISNDDINYECEINENDNASSMNSSDIDEFEMATTTGDEEEYYSDEND